ncbi:MAG: undecaprenyldiphospho-muramoylpentapeptide beta-N-acetylglucosaminyltransferase [Spirochaetaceae bacterium]|jgi:UDP-N-acetylglucosamine--N-acetylmuramyl-(pentapeptide) pyrophosphoryl-undecaprenol N-acetylglucosamine transferase|nr:undecaprenyldiphospho-muramoylpentapeptide beta-N-acetylglucosaminyltransferase [Spirochaetaceae bacterium]
MVSIAFAGGGTGGHIYPGLAVAAALRKLIPCRVFWIGAGTGMDRSIVEGAGLTFFGIPAGKLRRSLSLKNFGDAFRVLAGCFAALSILRREKPALLFSKGGFASVPPCAAAAFLGITVFTHESDYSPGLATRINLLFARRVFTAFAGTEAFLPPAARSRVTRTGNPIRREFFEALPERGRAFLGAPQGRPVLLVLGGSLGARQLNGLVRDSLPALKEYYFVAHQTGPGNDWDIPPDEGYRSWPFIGEDMPHALAAADLVLCRSGAGTVWECASLGKPMILLPLSGPATRGDQVENARCLEKAGAALVLDGTAGPETLLALVKLLARDGARRESMAQAAAAFAPEDAAGLLAEAIAAQVQRGAFSQGEAGGI